MNFNASEYTTNRWIASASTTTPTYAPRRSIRSQPNSAARLNIRQNTAYGARRMTRPISVIETSNRPSMPRLSVSAAALRVSTRPTPSISAKNITARMVLFGRGLDDVVGHDRQQHVEALGLLGAAADDRLRAFAALG